MNDLLQAARSVAKLEELRNDFRECMPGAFTFICNQLHLLLNEFHPENPIAYTLELLEEAKGKGATPSDLTQQMFLAACFEWQCPYRV